MRTHWNTVLPREEFVSLLRYFTHNQNGAAHVPGDKLRLASQQEFPQAFEHNRVGHSRVTFVEE